MFTVSDNRTIKLKARQVMRETRPRPVLVTVLFLLILLVFAFFRAKLSGVLDPAVFEQIKAYSEAAAAGNHDAAVALEVFKYRVATTIGAYVAAMNGVDAIAFTAGIGENDADTRAGIVSYLGYLGIELCEERNKVRGENVKISTDDSKVAVCVIPTNEELAICRDTVAVISANK